MEPISESLKNQKKDKELPSSNKKIDICPVCGEPLGKLVKMPFGEIVGPRACKCKRDKTSKEKAENDAREKQGRLQAIIKNSMMNENFKKCTFKAWDHSKGIERLYKAGLTYVNNFQEYKQQNQGLLIYGNPGNGKTYFSACVANELIKRIIPVICVSSIALIERINESRNNYGNEGIFTVLNSLNNADLLILDDLGTETDTKWTRSMMYQIIEKRYSSNLPIIITTNISLTELRDRYDDRVCSRLNKMCTFFNNTGKDIRKEEGKEKTQEFLKELFK